ncbi:MAG: ABC transporter permease [Actinomycetota bacterium]
MLVIAGAAGAALVVVPLVGLLVRTPWSSLGERLSDPVVLDAARLSVLTSLLAATLATVLGVPLAWLLARTDFPGRRLLRAVVTLPMVLPPVVGGAALLFALGRRSAIGRLADEQLGVVLPFSTTGVVIANTFVALPFLVLTVEGAIAGLDGRHEAVASSLGASRWTVFRRIVLPMIRPSLGAGIVLAWARAFGEFGATITFAGNLEGRTRTLPLAVFVQLDGDRDTAIAMSLLMVVVSVGILFALRERWWPADRSGRRGDLASGGHR